MKSFSRKDCRNVRANSCVSSHILHDIINQTRLILYKKENT